MYSCNDDIARVYRPDNHWHLLISTMIIAKLIGSLSLLAVYPHDHPHISNDCLAQSYIGTYGTQSVFNPSESCVNSSTSTADVPSVHPDAEFVWIEQAALEPYLLTDHPFSLPSLQGFLAALSDTNFAPYGDGQQPLPGPIDKRVLHHTSTSALLALSSAHVRELSLILPPTWRIYALSLLPFPFRSVPERALERVRDILSSLIFNPEVAKIVTNISLAQVQNDIRFLTGEDGKSGIMSRHSFSSGARVAVEWLKFRFEETGAKCELKSFLPGFAPNIVWCVLYSSPPNALHDVITCL